MAEFYGRVQGGRGEATRQGTRGSGISSTAETWGSVLRVSQAMCESYDHIEAEHVATFMLTGKGGGMVLYAQFDADGTVKHQEHPEVKRALAEVRGAFSRLAEVVEAVNKAND